MNKPHEHIEQLKAENAALKSKFARYEDNRPITEEWLREVGFSHYELSEKYYLRIGHDFEVDHNVYLFWSVRCGVTFGSSQGRAYPLQIDSRGHLLRLADALKQEGE